jgi:hypothetical protein
MTREEAPYLIREAIRDAMDYGGRIDTEKARDNIMELLDGWKLLEEFVRCPVCGEEYSANQLMKCVEGWEEGR